MYPKDAEGIANSVDPDQTALGITVVRFYLTIMCLYDAGGMANNVDPNQTPRGWLMSTLLAQNCPFKYLQKHYGN